MNTIVSGWTVICSWSVIFFLLTAVCATGAFYDVEEPAAGSAQDADSDAWLDYVMSKRSGGGSMAALAPPHHLTVSQRSRHQHFICVYCTTYAHICDPIQACYPRDSQKDVRGRRRRAA